MIRSGRRAAISETASVTASISTPPMSTGGIPAIDATPYEQPLTTVHGPSQAHRPELARLLPVSPATSAHGLNALTVRYG